MQTLLKLDQKIIIWPFHEINYDSDPAWIFRDGGAIEATLPARKPAKSVS